MSASMFCYHCAGTQFLQFNRILFQSNRIFFARNFFTCRSYSRSITSEVTSSSSPGPNEPDRIIIPKRKKRDELSILRALAATVKNDATASHFKFIDDPYLIPTSGLEKRAYALAKVSGQKAAKYVVDRYPGNFAHSTAEPRIEAFMPPAGFGFLDDTVEGLKERVERRKSLAAYESYQKATDAGVKVDSELAEDLLDLLCMYNSDDPPGDVLSDELYFRREIAQDNTKKIRNQWKAEGPAEMLFRQMPQPTVRASCSIIRGRAKYFQTDKAYEEFKRLRDQGVTLDVKTYNAIIMVASFIFDRIEARWRFIQDTLRDMASEGLKPDLDTFNAVLYVLHRCSHFVETRQWFMQTMNEMKSCDIEPSLTSWYYGLQIFYKHENAQSRFLSDVVEHLRGKHLKLRESTDYEFFSSAMIKCYINLKDLDLAYKLNNLLLSNNNIQFLGDGFRESLYYVNFLRLLCLYEQIDKVMDYYNSITPHKHTPTFTVIHELLNAIELNEGYQYLPKIWSDMVMFQYMRRVDLVENILSIMAKKKHDSQLQTLFVKTTKGIQNQFESDSKNQRLTNPLTLSGKMIGNMSIILLNADDFAGAWHLTDLFIKNRNQISGFPSEDALFDLSNAALEKKDVEKLMQLLSLMSDFGYPKLDELVEKAKTSMNLTDHQRSRLDDLLR